MCKLTLCSIIVIVIGAVLVVGSFVASFLVVPGVVENIIKDEVVLIDDTIQMERFKEIPFPLTFKVVFLTFTNPEEVLAGAVPSMAEVGPYVYKLYQYRNITHVEENMLKYRRLEHFEFDAEASYPLTEDDMVTIVNVPYHAIIQIAEQQFPSIVSVLGLAMNNVFGVHNAPIITARVRDLLFDGIRLCDRPGLVGAVVCNIIRDIGASAQNLAPQEDGSLLFSFLGYKNGNPSVEYEVNRGLEDSSKLGQITFMDGMPHFMYWVDSAENEPGHCNMINGTDSGIFAPFVDRDKPIYAVNTDICRSVELRYQYDSEVGGIPIAKFTANEWLLDNADGCFCLNVTEGITKDDGCLLEGATELYTCVGAMMVLSYPHFLYADMRYRNGVLGMSPNEDIHRIFLDIEPNTGTPIQAAKRAQFNIFMRSVSGISPTNNLRTTLTPALWVEESILLPEEYQEELRSRMLRPLRLLDIMIPVVITLCCLVLLVGVALLSRALLRKSPSAK